MTENIISEFKTKVSEQINLVAEGLGRYIVEQPFSFADGDHFQVILKKEYRQWVLTDEGHTIMHLSYDDLDLRHGQRASLLEETLTSFGVRDRQGELVLAIPDERFGDALFSFLQALNKIYDLRFLDQERVRSTFFEDARKLMENLIPASRLTMSYFDPQRDPDANYRVDCRINGMKKPNFVFFIAGDNHCRNATIVCHQFRQWGVPHRATGIFENQTTISRRAVAQFSDVAYKSIPSLGSESLIREYFDDVLSGS